MKRLLLGGLLMALLSCGGAPRAPELPSGPPESPFSIRLQPALAQPGMSVWVHCHVPRSYPMGWLTYGIIGIRTSRDDLITTKMDYRQLIERLPPGKWEAICAYESLDGRKIIRRATLGDTDHGGEGSAVEGPLEPDSPSQELNVTMRFNPLMKEPRVGSRR